MVRFGIPLCRSMLGLNWHSKGSEGERKIKRGREGEGREASGGLWRAAKALGWLEEHGRGRIRERKIEREREGGKERERVGWSTVPWRPPDGSNFLPGLCRIELGVTHPYFDHDLFFLLNLKWSWQPCLDWNLTWQQGCWLYCESGNKFKSQLKHGWVALVLIQQRLERKI